MQIKFIQSEIEEAIEDRIRGQVTVDEGMEIRIDLKATRGADGYQAIIDIVPEGTPVAEVAQPVARAPKAPGSVSDPASGIVPGRRKRRTKAEMEADRLKEAGQTEQQVGAQAETAPETAVEAASETAEADPVITTGADEQDAPAASDDPAQETPELVNAEATVEETAEEAPPASNRPSIFSGLNKPVNS